MNRLPCTLRAAAAVLGAIFCTVLLSACGQTTADTSSDVQTTAEVSLQPAQQQPLEALRSAYGQVEFAADGVSALSLQSELQVVAVLATPGETVHRGAPLLRLQPSAASRLDYDQAKRDAALADAELQRMQRLRATQLATEAELQSARNQAAAAAERRDSLAARIGGGVRTLRAPRDGIVEQLNAQAGDLLAAGAVAARIAAPDALRVRLGVDPAMLPELALQQAVHLHALNGDATAEGHIRAIDPRVDAQTRLAGVLVALPAGARLPPGAAVRGDIVVARDAQALVVPRAALLYDGDQPYVYVDAGGTAHRHAVKLGIETADLAEISSGLQPGARVVTAGNAVLKDGMKLRVSTAAGEPAP